MNWLCRCFSVTQPSSLVAPIKSKSKSKQQRLIDHVYSCARRYHTDSHHRVLLTSNASGSDDSGPLLDRCYYDQSVLDHIGGDIFNTATQKVASSYFKTNNAVPLVASRVALPSR